MIDRMWGGLRAWAPLMVAGLLAGAVPVATVAQPVGAAVGQAGELRVTTSPPVGSLVVVDGVDRDTWGLTWLDVPSGEHEVCFTDMPGYRTPSCEQAVVPAGGTGEVSGSFTQLTALKVSTLPAVPSTISVRDVTAGTAAAPRDDWGVFSWIAPGHGIEVCFGPVAGYSAPGCETVPAGEVTSGDLVEVTGVFSKSAGAPGQDGVGYLRVVTSPAVPSSISVDGEVRDDWGLDWLKLEPGVHEVCFSDVPGYTTPACQDVQVDAGATATAVGAFDQLGWLKIRTNPPSEATIGVDGVARNDWGAWFPIAPGVHEICFTPDVGVASCQEAQVGAGDTVEVVEGLSVPGAPSGLSGTARDGSADFTWDPPSSSGGSAITHYQLGQGSESIDCPSTACSYTGLENGTPYEFRVVACNELGCGPASNPVQVTPFGDPYTPVVNVEVQNQNLHWTWSDPGGNGRPVTHYILYLDNDLIDSNYTGTTFDRSFGFGETHRLDVVAVNSGGRTGAGGGASGTTSSAPGSVQVSKGSPVSTFGCSTSACAYVRLTLVGLAPGIHTVQCWGSQGGDSVFYSYSTSAVVSEVCYFGYPGQQVWAVVDGTYASNRYTW